MTRNPFDDIERMFDRMSRQLEGIEGDLFDARVPVDLEDTGESFVVTADLPGFSADAIDVELTGETLTISAERVDETAQEETDTSEAASGSEDAKADEVEGKDEDTEAEESVRRYIRRERTHRSLSRSIRLPDSVDEDATTASYTNGVLTVTLPKQDAEGGHHIPID